MKKIVLLCLVLFFIPLVSHALLILPTAHITIVKTTDGEDGNFDFQIRDTLVFTEYSEDFNIQTQNSTGSFSVDPVVFNTESFNISEFVPEGWKFKNVNCSGSGLLGGPTFPFGPETPQITVQAFANVTCTFNNQKSNGKTPLLIVPGIMGTEIFKGSTQLWANVDKMALTPGDRFMDPLAFNDDNTPLDTSLSLGSVIGSVPGFDYTKKLIEDLTAVGYILDQDLFLFPYDWRKDLDYTALQNDSNDPVVSLREKIDSVLSSTGASKLDIIAHSQGGLVVKDLLYSQPNYRPKVDKLVFVGTPHLGAPKAAKALLYGDSMDVDFLGMGLDPAEIKRIAKNMPSVYQLLPSSEYFAHSSGYLGNTNHIAPGIDQIQIYGYNETKQKLKDSGLNSALVDAADTFHDLDFDNFDFSGTGIDTYNIVGCQEATMGRILAKTNSKFRLEYVAGDGTVPVISASNVGTAHTYYALHTSHGTMMTGSGTREQIKNIIAGNSATLGQDMTVLASECHFNGQEVSVHSPVDLHIYDEANNHVGPNLDGTFDTNIPGVQYDTIGEEKFAFLPTGHTYHLELPATGAGTFDFFSQKIQDGAFTSIAYYQAVAITSNSKGTLVLNDANNQNIGMDNNGDGSVDVLVPPSATLNANQSQDITSPLTTSTLTGSQGLPGYYRSNVSVQLSSADPVVNSNPSQTSGLLNTQYQVDGGQWSLYNGSIPLSAEGAHTVNFFSTDKAGNNEPLQTTQFTIDKTPPEAGLQFDLNRPGALAVMASDNLDQNPAISFKPKYTLTDKAGNTTQLAINEPASLKFSAYSLASITYNQAPSITFPTNSFSYTVITKVDKSSITTQSASLAGSFSLLAVTANNSTKITGTDATGQINVTLPGLVLLKLTTHNGQLTWGY